MENVEFTDRYGLALSCDSSSAVEHYVHGVDLLLSLQPGADLEFDRALVIDPAFAMAHAALARFHQSWGRAAQARAAIAAARAIGSVDGIANKTAGQRKLTRREQQHIDILGAAIDGDMVQALRRLLEHLDEFPRDALAFGMALGAFGLLAFSGRPDHDGVRLGLSERMASAYGDDWWFLASLAWAHIEAGSLVAGERYIERSLALKADNANAIHVFAHLAYEQNRASESITRIDSLSSHYSNSALLHNHLRWHCALGALSAGRVDTVLTIYDRFLSPAVATAPLITAVTDAVSLLWRMQLLTGQSAGSERWRALADFVLSRGYQSSVAFLDVHVALLYHLAGEREALEKLLAQLRTALESDRLPAGSAVFALCTSLTAFAQSHPEQSIALLEANLGNVVRIGGSGAQRDIFEETLAAAYRQTANNQAWARNKVWQKVRANSAI